MLQKRFGQEAEREAAGERGATATAVAEATRAASQPQRAERSDEQNVSVFWRVFGGTILSMVALGAITLYNSISTSIAELRSELNREREARADLVRKDEFNSRTSTQYERIRSFEGLKAEFEGLKERASASAAAVEAVKKDAGGAADAVKKDAAAVEVLKERMLALEGVKKDVAGLDAQKEKLTAAVADLKAVRDDVMKIHQELERNRASDLERKASRDAQYKHVDETLKELQKGLQDCREKLARLEGSQPTAPRPAPTPDPKDGGTAKP